MESKPTFDEWYKAKRGLSFEEQYMQALMPIPDAMKALSIAMREYVSEMVQSDKR